MDMLEGQLIQHKLLAEYWIASVVSGHAKTRKIYRGIGPDQIELTDEEKIENAMQIVMNHIRIIGEIVDSLPPADRPVGRLVL